LDFFRDKENREKYIGSDENGKKQRIYQCSKDKKIDTVIEYGKPSTDLVELYGQRYLRKTMAMGNYSSGLQPTERFDLTQGSDNRTRL
jgi:threonyl-tRNA synthetase